MASAHGRGRTLAGKRFAIFGIYYAPDETGIAPYTTGLAEHLVSRGASVTVVTGVPHYPAWRIANGYRGRWRCREMIRGVDVRRVRHSVPRRQGPIRRALYEGTYLAHAALVRDFGRPDAVLGVIPNLGGGVVAAMNARRHQTPFGLIVQDLSGPAAVQSGMAGGGAVSDWTRTLEGAVARKARRVAVVADGFRPYLISCGVAPERIIVLRNWSHVSAPMRQREDMRRRMGWATGMQIVLHAGNMGMKQGLENVIAAARLALERRPNLRFVLMGDGNQRRHLETQASGLPNVSFAAPQPADWFTDVLAAADVLLVNERATVVNMSLPSKLTSYFIAGRPVVAAVPPGGTTWREIEQSGAGLLVAAEEPAALLGAVDSLAADPMLARRLADAGLLHVKEHLSVDPALARAEAFVLDLLYPEAGTRAPRRTGRGAYRYSYSNSA